MKNIIAIIGLFLLVFTILIIGNRDFLMQYYKNYQGIQAYKSQNFNEAEKYFSGSLSYGENEITYFNQGNNFYKQAQQEKNINKKRELLQRSIEKYSQALEYENRDFIENNYEIAQQELNKYKQEEEKKLSEDPGEYSKNDSQDNENQDSEENNDQDSQESGDEQNQQGGSQQDEQSENQDKFTQQQQAELEKYLQELKEIEENNQQFFNKQSQNQDFFEKFSNDPFLQNEFNRGGEKDW